MRGIAGYFSWQTSGRPNPKQWEGAETSCDGEVIETPMGVMYSSSSLAHRSGSRHIAFDGALFNSENLVNCHRLDLPHYSDADICLALFEKLGPAFVDEVDGIFAFIIADEASGNFFYGIDEMGVKPLYVSRGRGWFALGSTLDAFPRGVLSGVERVPPGRVWNRARRSLHKMRPIARPRNWTVSLTDAVRAQIPQGSPWSCALSGGVDSSVISLLAKGMGHLTTISCGLEGSADLLHARRVAELIQSTHDEHIIAPEEVRALVLDVVTATASFEPWLILGGVGTLSVARAAARRGTRVLLTGEGADELFAGYSEFDNLSGHELEAALRRQQQQLGATECLRLDRCTRAAGIEVRVPFLSRGVVAAVGALPAVAKRSVPGSSGSTNKVALREHARSLGLPDWVAGRAKVGFSTGTGVVPLVTELALADRVSWASIEDRKRFAAPGIDMDTPLAAWLLGLWLRIYGEDLANSWASLSRRGLVRLTTP